MIENHDQYDTTWYESFNHAGEAGFLGSDFWRPTDGKNGTREKASEATLP
ncbi:hypothetical protein ACFO25_05545 [Paenactinomyces guangxiensis]|uniref:Uncharacterized protein n=1 Tax=Paenactinomyces guangxiensis TaxID=1490290 RepID=A0A7W1WQP6_9BACL|nr:hypothetical protein [Paenactinomyces guangxiensis]MBA4494303.1 hypothetical protein [Paenactinomyces guangxiensis]MBH8590797.1 hypothetical protein [Paenactinomyces guangxiensis]